MIGADDDDLRLVVARLEEGVVVVVGGIEHDARDSSAPI
jgi:hypothetical protein